MTLPYKNLNVEIEITENGQGLPLPSYAHNGDAGMDLYAAEHAWVHPDEHALISCGFKIAIPVGYVGLICPRSGIAKEFGVTVLNAPGVLDSHYRGEVKVLLVHHASTEFKLTSTPFGVIRGERIAQMLIIPVMRAMLVVTEKLDDTKRGSAGFGSTGTSVL